MSKFIEVTKQKNKMLINVSEIAYIEPYKDLSIEGCMITLIHTTKRFTEGRKIFVKETYNEVIKLIQG